MSRQSYGRVVRTLIVLVALLAQETWALAGTTGRLSGAITDESGKPVAQASVTATASSGTATVLTDATGHFIFLSLIPDTYTVASQRSGYESATQTGVTVFADQTQTLALQMHTKLVEIARVRSIASSDLVKSGTTADVYSVNAATQDKVSAVGGGGGLNTAYSAIATVPGAFVPLNQNSYFQTVHIRGGDFDQVGYEVDGVPVNRSFDNYPSGAASSLGQQELQVYTGAAPANAEGDALAGYINQVIRTGTYPGFGQAYLGIGTPSFYHKASIEAGGASPDRLFSYYVGVGGYNSTLRYVDQSNGGTNDLSGPILNLLAGSPGCPAITAPVGCYTLAPYQLGFLANPHVRDVVANVHIGIPHKHDSGRDDVQILWDSEYLDNPFYSSPNDTGGAAAFGGAANLPTFPDGYQWTCQSAIGTTTTTLNPSCVSFYYFPTTGPHPWNATLIPPDERDSQHNNQEIVKLQYQKNFGSTAYLRLYGYTYFSTWNQWAPNSANQNYIACCPTEYNLISHTRGVSATYSAQLTDKNLLSLQGSYTTATSLRDNNTQMFNAGGTRSRGVVMVNANAPLSGYCFNATGNPATCAPNAPGSVRANFATWGSIMSGTPPALAASCNIPGGPAGPCTWLVAENSLWATYNTVTPKFTSASINDEIRPNERLLLNFGLRWDQFQFQGSDTHLNDPARQFWYAAWNLDNCVDSKGDPVPKYTLGLAPNNPCPATYTVPHMQNVFGTNTYNVLQPRFGATYTLNPDTVIRLSAGKFTEAPHAAYEQYNTLQEDTPFTLPGSYQFYALGYFNPGQHDIRPPTSWNFDVSLEKHIKGTDWSYKFTPFLRSTKDQEQQFFLDQKTAFVTALNVGQQTSEGVELSVHEGDFNRNGLSGTLAFTYTNSRIKFSPFPNGSTVLTPLNTAIQQYNSYTKAGGGSPCYAAGAPAACTAPGAISNPYYNAPPQGLLSLSDSYIPMTNFPGGPQSWAIGIGAPYFSTLVLNYKHDRLTITPSLQFQGGARYGAPETTPGIDPLTCGAALTPTVSPTDPRYPYGSAGGGAYDATSCGTIVIPDPYTRKFDGIGEFLQPNQLAANLQVGYDISPRVHVVGVFANLFNYCWGGTKAAWTLNRSNVCSYNILNTGGQALPVGNTYNPPATIDTFPRLVQFPYAAYYGAANTNTSAGNFNQTNQPFQFYLEARIKL